MPGSARERLTKAQVEALMAAVDSPLADLLTALERAASALHPGLGLDAALRACGRAATADAIAAGDHDAAWDLAAELNERRRL